MPDSKITALTSISTSTDPANDPLVIVDVSDTSMAATGTTKKVTLNQLLGASGTATLASATITGDLTVDTSTLKVDSTNNRVGIGTASPGYPLHIAGSSPVAALNSTAPSTSSISTLLFRNIDGNSNTYSIASIDGQSAGNGGYGTLIFSTGFNGSLVERMRLDTSGNLGLGVTPSAWSASSAIQMGNRHAWSQYGYAVNAYYDGSWRYRDSATAGLFQISGNNHVWYTAASGTAGNAITFTQAMTLDASGYLLLGTTDTAFTSGAGYKFGPGATPSSGQVGASTSNGDLTLRVYSTGAAAYRFYVGFGGTVFATNTTISAISDARLKENVQDIDVGLGAILALKPRKFDWKEGKGKNIKGDRGFIAQEFETVFPQLVDEWADPAPAGESPYKSVRQDLIPVLVKAIQELTARVQTLETR